MSAIDDLYDVALVGYGPTGATLASLLALQGGRVLVLDREAAVHALPRAIHFDGECMRVFQTLGLADALLPGLVVAPGMRFVNAQGQLLIDWTRPGGTGPQGWHASYRFHQPDLEAALRQRAESQPDVEVRLRHDVFAVEDEGDHVVLRAEDIARGKLLRVAARHVVGCDGARSLVRRCMGTELDDLRSHERWLVLDLVLRRERPDLGDHSVQFCNPARPTTYVRGVGPRRRWELMVMPGDDLTVLTRPETVWALLSPWLTPEDATLERAAVYTFRSVVARGWRQGRLLIAGDAAHQTPPFLGQGMCAGIRDAANLAWKLGAVQRGEADDPLLDSYESERAPHVREFIETAVRLGAVIQTTDPHTARQRDADLAARPQPFSTPEPTLGPGWHQGGRWAGRVSAQPPAPDPASPRRFDDRLGYRFALVVPPALAAAAQQAAGPALAVVVARTPALTDWLDALGGGAVLLRPDRYIAGTAADEAGLGELLRLVPARAAATA